MGLRPILLRASRARARSKPSPPLENPRFRRSFSQLPRPEFDRPSFGIAFDIDGVILRGRTTIGGSSHALRRLYHADGTLKVVLGHSPFRQLVSRFENELIVAVGKGEPALVMAEYGFKKVLSIDDYASYFNHIDPLSQYKTWSLKQSFDKNCKFTERVKGAFVVSDPVDWGRDIQVLCDILRYGGLPGKGNGHQPPLYFAADDLEYQAAFPCERLGMGAFRIALESIYNSIHSSPLEYTSYGKPNPSVFKNAESTLTKLALTTYPAETRVNKNFAFDIIYMIGDNPKVDVNGAKKAGHPWFPILTRTGVFKGKDNDEQFAADLVVDTVEEAVDFILKKENIQS